MTDFMGLGYSGPRWAEMGRVGPMGSWTHTGKPHGRVEIIGTGCVVRTSKAIFGHIGPHGRVGPHGPDYRLWAQFH